MQQHGLSSLVKWGETQKSKGKGHNEQHDAVSLNCPGETRRDRRGKTETGRGNRNMVSLVLVKSGETERARLKDKVNSNMLYLSSLVKWWETGTARLKGRMKNQHSGLIKSLCPRPAEWINGKEEDMRLGKQQHVDYPFLVK